MKSLVERVLRIQKDTEDIMKHAAGVLTEELGTKVLAIRDYGVQVADENWVLHQPGAVVTRRAYDSDLPYEVSADVDGVHFLSITADPAYEELVNDD